MPLFLFRHKAALNSTALSGPVLAYSALEPTTAAPLAVTGLTLNQDYDVFRLSDTPANVKVVAIVGPTVMGLPLVSVIEGATTVGTYTANEPSTWTLTGPDAPLFSITSGITTTATLTLLAGHSVTEPDHTFNVTVVATDSDNLAGELSVIVDIVLNLVAPAVVAHASITSTGTTVGSTITRGTATFSGSPTPSYVFEWIRSTVALSPTEAGLPAGAQIIPGQTGPNYLTTNADIGFLIYRRVIATNTVGTAVSVSNGWGPITNSDLLPLTLSVASVPEDLIAAAVIGTFTGKRPGSELQLLNSSGAVDNAGDRLAINASTGALVRGLVPLDYETAPLIGSGPARGYTYTIRETLTGSANSPRYTTLTLPVTDVVEAATGLDPEAPLDQSLWLTPQNFQSAITLANSAGGQTLWLGPGEYGQLTMNNRVFAAELEIRSAYLTAPNRATFQCRAATSTLTHLPAINLSGTTTKVRITSVDASLAPTAQTRKHDKVVLLNSVDNCVLEDVNSSADVGSNSLDPWAVGFPTGYLVWIVNCADIQVIGGTSKDGYYGLNIENGDRISVTKRSFVGINCDAINITRLRDGEIIENFITDARRSNYIEPGTNKYLHADSIQVFQDENLAGSRSQRVVIVGNIIDSSDGTYTQSIIIGEERWSVTGLATDRTEDIYVAYNYIYNGHRIGVQAFGVLRLTIINNTLLHNPFNFDSDAPYPEIWVERSSEATATNNITHAITWLSNTNSSQTNNRILTVANYPTVLISPVGSSRTRAQMAAIPGGLIYTQTTGKGSQYTRPNDPVPNYYTGKPWGDTFPARISYGFLGRSNLAYLTLTNSGANYQSSAVARPNISDPNRVRFVGQNELDATVIGPVFEREVSNVSGSLDAAVNTERNSTRGVMNIAMMTLGEYLIELGNDKGWTTKFDLVDLANADETQTDLLNDGMTWPWSDFTSTINQVGRPIDRIVQKWDYTASFGTADKRAYLRQNADGTPYTLTGTIDHTFWDGNIAPGTISGTNPPAFSTNTKLSIVPEDSVTHRNTLKTMMTDADWLKILRPNFLGRYDSFAASNGHAYSGVVSGQVLAAMNILVPHILSDLYARGMVDIDLVQPERVGWVVASDNLSATCYIEMANGGSLYTPRETWNIAFPASPRPDQQPYGYIFIQRAGEADTAITPIMRVGSTSFVNDGNTIASPLNHQGTVTLVSRGATVPTVVTTDNQTVTNGRWAQLKVTFPAGYPLAAGDKLHTGRTWWAWLDNGANTPSSAEPALDMPKEFIASLAPAACLRRWPGLDLGKFQTPLTISPPVSNVVGSPVLRQGFGIQSGSTRAEAPATYTFDPTKTYLVSVNYNGPTSGDVTKVFVGDQGRAAATGTELLRPVGTDGESPYLKNGRNETHLFAIKNLSGAKTLAIEATANRRGWVSLYEVPNWSGNFGEISLGGATTSAASGTRSLTTTVSGSVMFTSFTKNNGSDANDITVASGTAAGQATTLLDGHSNGAGTGDATLDVRIWIGYKLAPTVGTYTMDWTTPVTSSVSILSAELLPVI